MELSREIIEQYAERYPQEESRYEEEVEQLERLPKAFANGTWDWDDLEWIHQWKGNSRNLPTFRNAERSHTIELVEKAIQAPNITEKLELLTQMGGTGTVVASAFLLFLDPTEYTVIDKRGVKTLQRVGYLHEIDPTGVSIEDYLPYLECCRSLSNEYDVSLRKLDRAIWTMDKRQ